MAASLPQKSIGNPFLAFSSFDLSFLPLQRKKQGSDDPMDQHSGFLFCLSSLLLFFSPPPFLSSQLSPKTRFHIVGGWPWPMQPRLTLLLIFLAMPPESWGYRNVSQYLCDAEDQIWGSLNPRPAHYQLSSSTFKGLCNYTETPKIIQDNSPSQGP